MRPTPTRRPPGATERSFVVTATSASGGTSASSSSRSLRAPGPAQGGAQVAQRGLRVGGQLRVSRRTPAAAWAAAAWWRPPAGPRRPAPGAGSRTRCWPGAAPAAAGPPTRPARSFWLPSARVVVLRSPISAASSVSRSLSAVTSRALLRRLARRFGVSRDASLNRRLVVDSAGSRYSSARPTSSPRPSTDSAPRVSSCSRLRRVGASSVLNTSSRSTWVSVRSAEMRPPSAIVPRPRAAGREGQVHVPVGDPRQRRLADGRARAVGQRGVVLVDRQLEHRAAVVAQGHVLDRADGHAPGLDRVAGHDLGRVGERARDPVVPSARAEQDNGRRGHRQHDGGQHDRPHQGGWNSPHCLPRQ